MTCDKCKREVPENSAYCPFCGNQIVINKVDKSKIFIGVLSILVVALCLVIGCGIFYYQNTVQKLNNYIVTLQLEKDKEKQTEQALQDKILELEECNNNYEQQVENLISTIKDYEITVRKYGEQAGQFSKTLSKLSKAKTTNNIISVNNKIYAVKKGESITINIKWPSYGTTQYMGSEDGIIAETAWTTDSNLRVKGKCKGVTTVFFGSDIKCTKNRFEIVVICYE